MGARVLSGSVREFYDELAGTYHLIYADWLTAMIRQGAVLDRLIRAHLGPGDLHVLDAACGIGTQALGLAKRGGYTVRGSDISEASIERARREAASLELPVDFDVADMRSLGEAGGSYDVVMACDNALPHLLRDEDLARVACGALARLRPGGLFVASMRDYDHAVRTRPAVTEPQVYQTPEGTRIVFQHWDWQDDGTTYAATLFIVRQGPAGWVTEQHVTTYRALRRRELSAILEQAGFDAVRWHLPDDSGFFQPVVTARAPD